MTPPPTGSGSDSGPATFDSGSGSGSGPNPAAAPLADLLNSNRSLTTFSSLSRLQASTSSLLSSETATVLAPLNSALESLPRKPWEAESDYASLGSTAYQGDEGRDRADRNALRFVDAHIVPASPWSSEARLCSRAGRELWWELGPDGSTRFVMPDRVEVDRVAARAANGELWILKGVLNIT